MKTMKLFVDRLMNAMNEAITLVRAVAPIPESKKYLRIATFDHGRDWPAEGTPVEVASAVIGRVMAAHDMLGRIGSAALKPAMRRIEAVLADYGFTPNGPIAIPSKQNLTLYGLRMADAIMAEVRSYRDSEMFDPMADMEIESDMIEPVRQIEAIVESLAGVMDGSHDLPFFGAALLMTADGPADRLYGEARDCLEGRVDMVEILKGRVS